MVSVFSLNGDIFYLFVFLIVVVVQKKDEEDGNMKVELRVFLPDDSITTVAVLKHQKTDDVFKVQHHKVT